MDNPVCYLRSNVAWRLSHQSAVATTVVTPQREVPNRDVSYRTSVLGSGRPLRHRSGLRTKKWPPQSAAQVCLGDQCDASRGERSPAAGFRYPDSMTRRFDDDTPDPATVAGSFAAHVRVTATCSHCHRDSVLDLGALVAAGYGLTPLLSLPLRCGECGGRGHGVIVDGAHLGVPLSRWTLDDPGFAK